MKGISKILALVLAMLMLVTSFVACGDDEETDAETPDESKAPSVSSGDPENDRQSVKDDVPLDLNYANEEDNTVTFFTRDDNDMWKYEMDVDELLDDTLFDAIYYRNRAVEERLGVTITTISQPGAFGVSNEWNETLRNAVNTKTGDFDTAAIYMSTGSALAVEGMYYNVIDFPNISLEKPWWNQVIQEETTLFDALYYLAGDIAVTEVAGGMCIFYNKALFEDLYSTQNLNLYDIVEAGDWTIDKMYDLVEGAWSDDNSSGSIDNGDTVGFTAGPLNSTSDGGMDSWVSAMGIRLTEMEDGIPVLTFYNERTISAFEKVQNLYAKNPATLACDAKDRPDTSFALGKVLFSRATINSGSSADIRDMTQPYGVVPMPKYDTDQANYQTSSDNTVSLVVILSSLPTAKHEMVGATLELMAAESYKKVTPEYFEVAVKSKYSNDPRDADMYELILDTFVYTFGFVYSTKSIGSVGNLFRNMAGDFAQQYQANATKYETALDTLIDKLDEVAFNAQYGS